jgi:hypothetical protein
MRRIAPQQYRSAAQQRQANLLIGIAAMRSERRFPGGRQLPFVFQRVPGESAFPKRGLARSGAHRTSARVTYCNAANRRLTVSQSGASSALAKKEAARRRPESREETPKEGMHGKHRASNSLAPNPTNARSQYRI